MQIFVTNYGRGINSMPVEEYHKGARFKFDEQARELAINDALFVHVFDSIPYLRRIKANEGFFKTNIYHTQK